MNAEIKFVVAKRVANQQFFDAEPTQTKYKTTVNIEEAKLFDSYQQAEGIIEEKTIPGFYQVIRIYKIN